MTISPLVTVEVQFYPVNATLLLHMTGDIPGLDLKKIDAAQLGLSRKEEFHITLIGYDTGDEIIKSLKDLNKEEQEEQLIKTLQLIKSTEWEVRLKDEFYYIQKVYDEIDLTVNQSVAVPEKRKSIIQMVEIAEIYKFYERLNQLFGTQFDTPLPHITLYTTSTLEEKKLRGIGIYSKSEIEAGIVIELLLYYLFYMLQ